MTIPTFTAVSIFCEDIRDEINEQRTLVGLLPDNIAVSATPGMLPKLGLYTRMMIPVDAACDGGIQVILTSPSKKMVVTAPVDIDQICKAQADSKAQGSPVAIILTSMIASPFPIIEVGRFVATAHYMGEEYYSGSIKVIIGEDPTEAP